MGGTWLTVLQETVDQDDVVGARKKGAPLVGPMPSLSSETASAESRLGLPSKFHLAVDGARRSHRMSAHQELWTRMIIWVLLSIGR